MNTVPDSPTPTAILHGHSMHQIMHKLRGKNEKGMNEMDCYCCGSRLRVVESPAADKCEEEGITRREMEILTHNAIDGCGAINSYRS